MECKYELRCSRKGYTCSGCKHNHEATLKDCYHDKGYVSTCKYGHLDCILDPAYLKFCYNDKEADCDGCVDSCMYDDEDK